MAKIEDQREEAHLSDQVQILRGRIAEQSTNSSTVISLLSSLKELDKQESDVVLQRNSDCLKVQQEVDKLDRMLNNGCHDDDGCDSLDNSLKESYERFNLARMELAAKLRSFVSLKRQIDEVPSEDELIQYEIRSTELNTLIQKKHRQTRKHYDTYNTLMEINELMVKETSLLNSITLQFQNAITSADGRTKLINSLESISEGIQQKLEKVEQALQSEKKICDALEEKYASANSDRRKCLSVLKLIKEECKRNESLQAQLAQI